MSRRKRVLLAIVLVELVLAGIWFMLTMVAADSSIQPNAERTIGETMGMAMGGLLGLGFILYLMAAKADNAKP